jgi:RNA polymerase sigma-70 factor (ECF subfamily)
MQIDPQKLQDDAYRQEVFNTLLRDYQDRIFRYCVTRIGEAQGEEIAQEVFLTAWESLPKFRQDSTLGTWLVGIAKYKCIQAFRNRTRRQAIVHTFVGDIRHQAHSEGAETPEHTMADQTHFASLAHGLQQLQENERILLNLRYYKGLSVTEVAELVGKSEAAVRKRLLRALQRLRKLMEEAATG